MAHAMKRLRPELSPHSSRSAFKSWATTRTLTPPDVVEEAMGHLVGNRVERAYNRGEMIDKRRRLMEQWAQFCATPPAVSAEVVALRHHK